MTKSNWVANIRIGSIGVTKGWKEAGERERERERERVDNYFSRSKSLLFKNLFVVERNPGGPPNPSPALIIVEWFRCSR